jgi:hypothetical protein
MRRLAPTILAALWLAVGCGGDDDDAAPEAGASGAAGVAPVGITVGEFIAELRPDKQAILETVVAETPACKGVEVDSGFVLLVSAQAIDADQQSPLAELVAEQC